MRADIEKVRERAKAWNREHKELVRARSKAWTLANGERLKEYWAEYRKDPAHAAVNLERQREWRRRYPWYSIWTGARQRCLNPKHPRYARYGGRGIAFLLSKADMAFLWTRDNGVALYQPSIDRRDNDGPYSLENCCIIEKSANSAKHNHGLAEILLDK